MPRHDWYEMGQWLFCCDQCGLVYKSGLGLLRWDNAIVCPNCFEERQPQDFVRGVPDIQNTPWSRVACKSPLFFGMGGVDHAIGEVTFGDDVAIGGA